MLFCPQVSIVTKIHKEILINVITPLIPLKKKRFRFYIKLNSDKKIPNGPIREGISFFSAEFLGYLNTDNIFIGLFQNGRHCFM